VKFTFIVVDNSDGCGHGRFLRTKRWAKRKRRKDRESTFVRVIHQNNTPIITFTC